MEIFGAALISFVGVWLLFKHIPKGIMMKILGYKGVVDVLLHGTIIYMFFGTSTLGLMQAELCGIFVSLYLRGLAKCQGYQKFRNGRWVFYPGVFSP